MCAVFRWSPLDSNEKYSFNLIKIKRDEKMD